MILCKCKRVRVPPSISVCVRARERARSCTAGKYNSGRFHLLLSRATRGRHDREPFSHDPGLARRRRAFMETTVTQERRRRNKRRSRAPYQGAIVTKGIAELHYTLAAFNMVPRKLRLNCLIFILTSGRRLTESACESASRPEVQFAREIPQTALRGALLWILRRLYACLPRQAFQTLEETYRFDSSGLSSLQHA